MILSDVTQARKDKRCLFSLTPTESFQVCLLNLECVYGRGRGKGTMEGREERLLSVQGWQNMSSENREGENSQVWKGFYRDESGEAGLGGACGWRYPKLRKYEEPTTNPTDIINELGTVTLKGFEWRYPAWGDTVDSRSHGLLNKEKNLTGEDWHTGRTPTFLPIRHRWTREQLKAGIRDTNDAKMWIWKTPNMGFPSRYSGICIFWLVFKKQFQGQLQ